MADEIIEYTILDGIANNSADPVARMMNGLLPGLVLVGGFVLIVMVKRTRMSVLVGRDIRLARKTRNTDIDLVAAYHHAVSVEVPTVDDRTWLDLDMDQVLSNIDATASMIGTMMLYDRLRTPADPAALEPFSAKVEQLRKQPATAERIRHALAPLDTADAVWLPDIFSGELPSPVPMRWIYPVLALAMIPALISIAFWPSALIVVIALAFVNFLITLWFKARIQGILPALRTLPKLVSSASVLVNIDAKSPALSDEAAILRRHVPELGALKGAARWLLFDRGEANELVASASEYLNMLFLLSVNAFAFGLEQARNRRPALRETFEALGALDVAQSVATLRDRWTMGSRPDWTTPTKRLDIDGVWHPLLEAPVANSISVDGASLLVTGSNMSGKTTFIRTLGVAALLARTIETVPARRWRAPPLLVATSIARSDSLIEGKSYYLAEVERVRVLLFAKDDGRQHLFLLDEIFRGTNTTERVAAGKAVLAELDRGDDVVIVATHDLELLQLLGGRFVSYHFREEIDGDALRFDYAIKAGPSSTRNAIALLRSTKYPQGVVDDAIATVREIEDGRRQSPA